MRERPPIEPTAGKDPLGATGSIRLHWPEYLMEAGEAGLYLFSACVAATLLWHPASPLQRYLPSDAVRRMLMGSAMGATIIAIVLSPWGKQSGAHFNPAVTFAFYRLGKVTSWDAVFYCAAQLSGAVGGVALASVLLHGAPAHRAVRYAATIPGIYGDGIAFAAELAMSFILMSVVLFASNHEALAPYAHYFAAILVAAYIAFESPISGMSTNPARTFGPALCARYWHALWIYFIAPPVGMVIAAEVFLLIREGDAPYCAKLHHHNDKRCIFRHSAAGVLELKAPDKPYSHLSGPKTSGFTGNEGRSTTVLGPELTGATLAGFGATGQIVEPVPSPWAYLFLWASSTSSVIVRIAKRVSRTINEHPKTSASTPPVPTLVRSRRQREVQSGDHMRPGLNPVR